MSQESLVAGFRDRPVGRDEPSEVRRHVDRCASAVGLGDAT